MKAPCEGKVSAVLVKNGDVVEMNQPILEFQSVKLNTTILAEYSGKITSVAPQGKAVKLGQVIVKIQTAPQLQG